MSVFKKTADHLRTVANDLEGMERSLLVKGQPNLDVVGAARRIRAMIGKERFFTISPCFDFHEDMPRVEWTIYVADRPTESSFFKGATLDEAMELTAAALTPPPEPPPPEEVFQAAKEALAPLAAMPY